MDKKWSRNVLLVRVRRKISKRFLSASENQLYIIHEFTSNQKSFSLASGSSRKSHFFSVFSRKKLRTSGNRADSWDSIIGIGKILFSYFTNISGIPESLYFRRNCSVLFKIWVRFVSPVILRHSQLFIFRKCSKNTVRRCWVILTYSIEISVSSNFCL